MKGMTLSVNSSPSGRSVLQRSWDMIAPYRGKVFLGAFCALLATFFSVVSSYIRPFCTESAGHGSSPQEAQPSAYC